MKKMPPRKIKKEEDLIIIDNSDTVESFSTADTPVEPEENVLLKSPSRVDKSIGTVTIKVEVNCGNVPTTYLEDVFNIAITTKKIEDNTKILENHLINTAKQCKKLIIVWTEQVNK